MQFSGMHISSNSTAALQEAEKGCGTSEEPHRCFSAPAGTEEEDGVVAGLGDGAGDEVLELAAQTKPRRISETVSGAQRGRNGDRFGRLTCSLCPGRT